MPNAETEQDIIRKLFLRRSSLESSVPGKLACRVREGGDGKGPSRTPRRRPTSLWEGQGVQIPLATRL